MQYREEPGEKGMRKFTTDEVMDRLKVREEHGWVHLLERAGYDSSATAIQRGSGIRAQK
jgi:hypothetical protein